MSEIDMNREEAINRYLLNKMSDEERCSFEIELLEDPDLFNQLKLNERLKSELSNHQSLLAESSEQPIKPSKEVRYIQPFSEWLKQPFSLAACLILALGSVFTILNSEILSVNTAYRLTPVSDVIDIGGSVRGTESSMQVSRVTSGRYNLRVDVGFERANESFVVEISQIDNVENTLSLSAQVQANEFGLFGILFEGEVRSSLTLTLKQLDANKSIEFEEVIILDVTQ